MTVRNTYSDSLATAQAAWLEAEYRARAAFALLRLGSLDRLASQLTEADKFDAAYDVWDDYIDGRHADERTGSLDAADLAEQSTIFTRSLVYLGAKEGLALAQRAWGQQRFEVFTRSLDGTILGKLTYLGDPLRVTIALPGSTRTHALE
ncbi:hypothetical protein U0E18_31930, partial [Burkholderia pseudomallei]|uniref:hypothetical protein n=1 Tax=Burkholderia pseudomallei TaxID=28450 RepID=UPI002AB4C89E